MAWPLCGTLLSFAFLPGFQAPDCIASISTYKTRQSGPQTSSVTVEGCYSFQAAKDYGAGKTGHDGGLKH